MALYTKHTKGLLDGTEEVVLVPAAGAGANIVTMFRLTNLDTSSITFSLRIHDENKLGEDDEYVNVIPDTTLATQEYITHHGVMVALSGSSKLVIELAAEVAANQPQYQMVFVEES
tara:strand:+ start:2672 stop:3019 length:348 start_codon:yes stop_codon:yes gene_type:complete